MKRPYLRYLLAVPIMLCFALVVVYKNHDTVQAQSLVADGWNNAFYSSLAANGQVTGNYPEIVGAISKFPTVMKIPGYPQIILVPGYPPLIQPGQASSIAALTPGGLPGVLLATATNTPAAAPTLTPSPKANRLKTPVAILGGNNDGNPGPLTGNPGPLTGNPGPLTGNPGPLTGNPGPLTGNPGPLTGNPGPLTGNPGPLTGNPGPLTGNPGPLTGNPGPLTGNPDPGFTFPDTTCRSSTFIAVSGLPLGPVTLKWSPVPGATAYAVAIGGMGLRPTPLATKILAATLVSAPTTQAKLTLAKSDVVALLSAHGTFVLIVSAQTDQRGICIIRRLISAERAKPTSTPTPLPISTPTTPWVPPPPNPDHSQPKPKCIPNADGRCP